jgi:two-component system nitrogen regulation response regulator NtrX
MHVNTDHWPLSLTGSSTAVSRARAALTAAASTDAPVLIVSAPGLAAEAVARALHDRSRPGRPFLVVDCAAAAGGDVECVLFGRNVRPGHGGLTVVGAASALVKAREGTVFLRHITELPVRIQRRLARVLRDREVSAGGRCIRVKARVVADVPPDAAFDGGDGPLHEDLLRRLSPQRVDVPALRERPEDMRELVEALAGQLTGGPAPAFTQAALTVLAAPAWPGNLDELRAVLERVLRGARRDEIRQEDVLAHLPIDGAPPRIGPHVSLREARRQFERDYIASVLERHSWRMSEAARTLGIERANLYRKTRQLGIVRRSPDASVAS